MSATAPSPTGVGSILRRARKKRRISLSSAAEATRIWSRYLQALEDDAPISEFPAPVYARYFLREYAQCLGLDPEPLVDAFVQHHGLDEPLLEEISEPDLDRPRRWPGRVLVAMSVAALIAIPWLGIRAGRGPGVGLPAIAALPPAAAPFSPAELRRPPEPPVGTSFRGVRAVLHVNGPCWVRAVADGRLVVQRTLQPGRSMVLKARRTLELVLGNGGGVSLQVNGRPVPTGVTGQVVRLSFAWRNGRVVRA